MLEQGNCELRFLDKQIIDALSKADVSEEDLINDAVKADEYSGLFNHQKQS